MDQRKTSQESTKGKDPATRAAALWATVIALPAAVVAGLVAFAQLSPEQPSADPSPSAARPQPTEPVTMAAPKLEERPATVCRALLANLPASLDDLQQRPVSAGPEQNAAYGDPPITLSCGVPAPTVPPTDQVWVVNGVCWHPVEQPETVTLTTVDREVPVQLSVPRSYDRPLQWAAPIAKTVAASVPPADSAPSGCSG